MQKNTLAIVLIILGIIVLAFPLLGLVPISILTGLGVAFLGIGLILAGFSDRVESSGLGLLEIVLGIIALVLGLGFILNPGLFSFVAGLIVYMAGLFLIIVGIVALFTKAGGSRWNGVVAIIIGLIYLIFGYFISNPFYLGILIGLWLLITGILMFFQKD
jgi:membrane protein HdeD